MRATVRWVADHTGLSNYVVRRMCETKALEAIRTPGGHWRIDGSRAVAQLGRMKEETPDTSSHSTQRVGKSTALDAGSHDGPSVSPEATPAARLVSYTQADTSHHEHLHGSTERATVVLDGKTAQHSEVPTTCQVDAAEMARLLGHKITPETLMRWARSGRIPATKVGRKWPFVPIDVP
jgi:hypothetical protein